LEYIDYFTTAHSHFETILDHFYLESSILHYARKLIWGITFKYIEDWHYFELEILAFANSILPKDSNP
jgi:hypothetical protein